MKRKVDTKRGDTKKYKHGHKKGRLFVLKKKNGKARFQIVNNCLNASIYSKLET